MRGLPGRPDLASMAGRWAVFVNGCFWHDHGCGRTRRPRTRRRFWDDKLDRNMLRDALALADLRAMGFRALTVWECEVHDGRAARALSRFLASVTNGAGL